MTISDGQLESASVKDAAPITKPRVIPQNQLVILRESELSTDLASAIQEVRESEDTAGSRILIVAPDDEAKARFDSGPLPMPALPMSLAQVARSGGQKALEQCGNRLAPMLSSLSHLFDEVSKVVDDIAALGPEALLAHVKGLKTKEQALKSQAEDLRKQAATMDAQATAMRARVEAVEKFTSELAALLAPPAPAPPVAPAEPAAAPPAEAAQSMNAMPEPGDGAS